MPIKFTSPEQRPAFDLLYVSLKLFFSSSGVSQYKPDQDLHGDRENSHPTQPGEPVREPV